MVIFGTSGAEPSGSASTVFVMFDTVCVETLFRSLGGVSVNSTTINHTAYLNTVVFGKGER
jgi:hypothetical protein